MRTYSKYIITILQFVLFSIGCKHDILSNINPVNTDTTVIASPPIGGGGGTGNTVSDTVCFNTDILPLYVSYCGSSGCHDANSHKEGVVLTDYAHIMNGIRAKNASGSKYYTIISNSMPPRNATQMSTTNINTILKWINQGALNTQCTNVCDTTSFTYSGTIQTILSINCGGCHGTSPGTANVYLGTYASAKTYISANTTIFLNAINWTSTNAAMNMPQSSKLVACKITQIQKWINNGYPQ